MTKALDLTNHRFGDWTALYRDGAKFWRCRCACGTERAVRRSDLRSGKSTGCGCRSNQSRSERIAAQNRRRNEPQEDTWTQDGGSHWEVSRMALEWVRRPIREEEPA